MELIIILLLVGILATINPAFKDSLIAVCFFGGIAITLYYLTK